MGGSITAHFIRGHKTNKQWYQRYYPFEAGVFNPLDSGTTLASLEATSLMTIIKNVKVGNDHEMMQPERTSHSKNPVG